MKIAITGKIGKIEEIEDDHTLVCTVKRLRILLGNAGIGEDIEGKIYPSAKHNPELMQMLKEIHDYKRRLYEHTGRFILDGSVPYPIHRWFQLQMKNHNMFI